MLRARMASAGKLVLVAALCLPYGCSLINRPIVYEDARETPPLQVPNGLIAPAPNPALQIPAVAGVASNVDAAPPTLGTAATAAPAASGAATAAPRAPARAVSPGARSLAADRASRGAPDPDDVAAPAHGA